MAHKASMAMMENMAKEFLSLKNVTQLCSLLHLAQNQLPKLISEISYNTFKMRKKSGGFRLIEDPNHDLKDIQTTINEYLQPIYFQVMPEASHGFIASPDNKDELARNILTNTRKHINHPYLVNIDLLDFFHYVTSDKVAEIFKNFPFHFEKELVDMLLEFCTFNNRLPMGAPTSPVLSNFALIDLDHKLTDFAKANNITYSRFVDDMSFSSKDEITATQIESIESFIKEYKYELNLNKIKYYGPEDKKIITGITLIGDTIGLEDSYIHKIEVELEHLKKINLANTFYDYRNDKYIEKLRAAIKGRIEFAKVVLGPEHGIVNKLLQSFNKANKVEMEDYGAISWLDFDY